MSVTSQSPSHFVRNAMLFEGSLALVAIALGRFLATPPWVQIRWNWPGIGWGLAACVPLLVAMLGLRQLRIGPLGRLNRIVDEFVVPLFAGCTILDFALISLVGGLGEELLFRGVIQAALAKWLGIAAGIAVASLLFGLAHIITPAYAVMATIIGIYFGWLWLETGNLLAPIVAHAAYDFAALAYLTRRGLQGGIRA
ncbi:MAG TPA: CPBP family intramembrane glutamic endopeptidase [Pirellulales bacterium]|jgi:membrane protease YdiL (CAAX protease family)|nr:CPBP family intramembrane glutamic endopeptidase [Pirellulales bacterium]